MSSNPSNRDQEVLTVPDTISTSTTACAFFCLGGDASAGDCNSLIPAEDQANTKSRVIGLVHNPRIGAALLAELMDIARFSLCSSYHKAQATRVAQVWYYLYFDTRSTSVQSPRPQMSTGWNAEALRTVYRAPSNTATPAWAPLPLSALTNSMGTAHQHFSTLASRDSASSPTSRRPIDSLPQNVMPADLGSTLPAYWEAQLPTSTTAPPTFSERAPSWAPTLAPRSGYVPAPRPVSPPVTTSYGIPAMAHPRPNTMPGSSASEGMNAFIYDVARQLFLAGVPTTTAPPHAILPCTHTAKRQPITAESECYICLELMKQLQNGPYQARSVTWCKRGCGQNVHRECLQRFAVGNPRQELRCPICRAVWYAPRCVCNE